MAGEYEKSVAVQDGARAVALFTLGVVLLLFVSCARSSPAFDAGSHREEIERWKAERLASIKSDDGWLSLTGLYWLKEGENNFGSDPSANIALPAGKAPPLAGTLHLNGGKVKLEARPGAGITHNGQAVSTLDLKSDEDGAPTILSLGPLRFNVIKRGDKFGLRVKDLENPARASFRGLEYFPVSDKWRVLARLERFDPQRTVLITNVLGMEENYPSPGTLVFEVDGGTYRLDAVTEKGEEKMFIILADATSGKGTYGGGRYLYADPPGADGKVVLDFNKAHSPPCAFTNFATCPLPPSRNRLPILVEAGEKYTRH